jgi:hypothetical protein
MNANYTVWLVDDLPKNRSDFERNHATDFNVSTFEKPSEVLSRIHKKEYPDALLVDVFFYDTPGLAQKVEKEVATLAQELKEKATQLGLLDHRFTAGITLMENIYQHFNKKPPPFPMYAYTTKGPYLLEQKDWQKISDYGAEVLLKGRVAPQSEATEIIGDIETFRAKKSWKAWIGKLSIRAAFSLWPGLFWLVVGWVGGWLSHKIW